MVPRADLVAAMAEVKAAKDELEAKERETASLNHQLSKAKEQRRDEQAAMSEMVARSELIAAVKREEEATALSRAAAEKHREATARLESKLAAAVEETEQLRASLQVHKRNSPKTATRLVCDVGWNFLFESLCDN